ncbi:MAG: VanW family protein, partial [Cytophagaceae bacterium]
MKRVIPYRVKVRIKLILRLINDLWNGNYRKFASPEGSSQEFIYKISITQAILPSSTADNKVLNILNASEKINRIVIGPGELFSFWRIVGKPDKSNGYMKGRNIIAGQLQEDYGGGLCQLSGIIYYASLISSLEVTERYNHTIDIYTDETRYTPLGSDATVVYGYKDLRIKNNYDFSLKFNVAINNNTLHMELLSQKNIKEEKILFKV